MTAIDESAPLQLSTGQRQLLLAALYQRQVCPTTAPEVMAEMAVMPDADLLDQLVNWECAGDNNAARALAKAGLSRRPVQVISRCMVGDQLTDSDPIAINVEITVEELHRWQLNHFSVRDMEGFGSLRMELPIPPGAFALGYSNPPQAEAPVLLANAVLTNGDNFEPMIAFEVVRAWPGRLDQSFITAPQPLAQLRQAVAREVGDREILRQSSIEGGVAPTWVWHKPDDVPQHHAERGG